jgi:hypothetical protein
MGYHAGISRLAMAIQVRGGRKHASVSLGFTFVMAPRRPSTRTSSIRCTLTGAAVCPLALVFDWFLVRQKKQRRQEQKCKQVRVGFAPALYGCLRGGIIASSQRLGLREPHGAWRTDLDDCSDWDGNFSNHQKV